MNILPTARARELYLFSAVPDLDGARDEIQRILNCAYGDRLSGLYGMAVEADAVNSRHFEQARRSVADRTGRVTGSSDQLAEKFWTACAETSQKAWTTRLPMLTALAAEWEVGAAEKLALVGGPKMQEFERRTRLYRRGLTPWRVHLRELFPGPVLPNELVVFNDAVRLENSIDFRAVDSERRVIIELLTQKLEKQDLMRLIDMTISSLEPAALTQEFTLDMKSLIDNTDIDLQRFPAMADYCRYCDYALRARPKTMLALIWDTHVSTYSELSRSTTDARAVRSLLEAYLATRALAYASKQLELVSYDGERRTPPTARRASRRLTIALALLIVVMISVVWLAGR